MRPTVARGGRARVEATWPGSSSARPSRDESAGRAGALVTVASSVLPNDADVRACRAEGAGLRHGDADAVDVRGSRAENLALRFNARSWTASPWPAAHFAAYAGRSPRARRARAERSVDAEQAALITRRHAACHAEPLAPVAGANSQILPSFAWSPVAGAARYGVPVRPRRGLQQRRSWRGEDQFFTRNSRATLKKTSRTARTTGVSAQ